MNVKSTTSVGFQTIAYLYLIKWYLWRTNNQFGLVLLTETESDLPCFELILKLKVKCSIFVH